MLEFGKKPVVIDETCERGYRLGNPDSTEWHRMDARYHRRADATPLAGLTL